MRPQIHDHRTLPRHMKKSNDAVLHIRAPETDLRCKYSNTQVRLTAKFKPVIFGNKYLEYTLNIHNLKMYSTNEKPV